MRGVNKGMQIRRSVPFFRPIRQSADIFDQIRKINVNATVASNFAPNSEESDMLDDYDTVQFQWQSHTWV